MRLDASIVDLDYRSQRQLLPIARFCYRFHGWFHRYFGFVKVRYRRLKKNHEWPCAAFAAINVYQHRKRLARANQRLAPQGA
jgi:hypothetical protein